MYLATPKGALNVNNHGPPNGDGGRFTPNAGKTSCSFVLGAIS